MTFFVQQVRELKLGAALVAAMALTGCAAMETDDTTGSRLTQPPPSQTPNEPTEAGDIAIAGQYFSHAVLDLPVIANAPKPPLVQFTGVTSIVNGPVDTEPYTDLLRDRLLLGTREKLRFVERELPPLITHPKKIHHKEDLPPSVMIDTNPDYQVMAELRGKYDDDLYRVQIQLVDFHTGEVIYDGLYHIRKEAQAATDTTTTTTEVVPGQDYAPASQPQSQPTPGSGATPADTQSMGGPPQ